MYGTRGIDVNPVHCASKLRNQTRVNGQFPGPVRYIFLKIVNKNASTLVALNVNKYLQSRGIFFKIAENLKGNPLTLARFICNLWPS